MCLSLKIVAIVLSVYSICILFCGVALTVHAQSDLQTIKYRNLVIDLGNGVKTNAQLTFPAIGKGPFPGVLTYCMALVLMIRMKHWDLFTRMVLNHLHHFGR